MSQLTVYSALSLLLCALPLQAKIVEKTIDYKEGSTVLEGVLIYDDAISGQKPGILVVHDWMGPSQETKAKARVLASEGYVAFVADIYGKGQRPQNAQEAAQFAGKYKSDRPLLRLRAQAGLEALRTSPGVNVQQLGAIGFCFGGTTVLELARSGANLQAGVSFHGGLDSPSPADGSKIRSKLLILHGANDPFVPETDIQAFQKELRDAKVDWQMIYYSNAVHSFTNTNAGNDPSKGAAFEPVAAARSLEAMKSFFKEVFKPKP